MSSLNIIERRPPDPENDPGSPEWCAEVREVALDRALATLKDAKVTCGDVVGLLKIRRALIEAQTSKQKIVWVDPKSWGEDPPKAA